MMKLIITLLLSLSCLFSTATHASGIPVAENLQQTARDIGVNSQQQQKVFLLLVSQAGCSYCEQISTDIIRPMQRNKGYRESTVFLEIEINRGHDLLDFSGNKVSADDFAKRYNAWATPTLLFIDHSGTEVAEKMIGYNTPELYGYYVDRSLKQGFNKINSPSELP